MALDFCLGDCGGAGPWPLLQTLATGLLVVGAFAAAWQVHRQIAQAAEHNDRQIQALLRPVVIVGDGDIDLDANDRRDIFPPIANVGVGPGLDIAVSAWIAISEPGSVPPISEAPDRSLEEAKVGPPHLQMRRGVLGVGGDSREWLILEALPDLEPSRGKAYSLVYEVEFTDAAGFQHSYLHRVGGLIR